LYQRPQLYSDALSSLPTPSKRSSHQPVFYASYTLYGKPAK
jgi:hypothetical protein